MLKYFLGESEILRFVNTLNFKETDDFEILNKWGLTK